MMKDENQIVRDIHVQSIVAAIAAAILNSFEWEAKFPLELGNLNIIEEAWDALYKMYGEYAVQELCFDQVRSILEQLQESVPGLDTKIINSTLKYLRIEIQDKEKFESWLGNTLRDGRAAQKERFQMNIDRILEKM